MQKKEVIQHFHKKYNTEPYVFVAPGRINIIGEHTDYNDGYVLPAAIDKAIYFAIKTNGTPSTVNATAVDLTEDFTFDINQIAPKIGFWGTYIMGVCSQLQKNGYKINGFDVVFSGDIPLGAGLSSSAALECGLLTALNDIFSLGIEKVKIALMGQQVEHTYAGVNCGIMDQFASVMGEENAVIRLDCRDMSYQLFPFELGENIVVLCDSAVKHELASSEYNTRRKECEEGLAICNKLFGVKSLRDVTMAQLEAHKGDFPDIVYKRLHYVVGEVLRVETACQKMKEKDLATVGQMMYATHDGLSREYGVSCEELDFLVDQTRNDSGVIGARMMGGGFGGCTINIVKGSYADAFIEKMSAAYKKRFSVDMKAYKTTVKKGCHKE